MMTADAPIDHVMVTHTPRRKPWLVMGAGVVVIAWLLIVTFVQIDAKYDGQKLENQQQVLIDRLATVLDEAIAQGANVASPEAIAAGVEGATVSGIGPQGERGEAGPTGPPGEEGDRGPQGVTGDVGAQGVAGPPGPQGDPGPTGAPGSSGSNGTDGAPGSLGAVGLQGEIGAQGPAGPSGAQGDPGPAGAQGDPGAAGPAGAPGADGAPGAPATTEGLVFTQINNGVLESCTVIAGVCNFQPVP